MSSGSGETRSSFKGRDTVDDPLREFGGVGVARSEERKKSVTAELAADVKRHQDEVSNQSQLVSNGYEYRDIKCEIQYHVPEKGKKTIVRLDNGEVVRVAFMTGLEMQEAFQFEESQPA